MNDINKMPPKYRYCPNCGVDMRGWGANFRPYCGADMKEEDADE